MKTKQSLTTHTQNHKSYPKSKKSCRKKSSDDRDNYQKIWMLNVDHHLDYLKKNLGPFKKVKGQLLPEE